MIDPERKFINNLFKGSNQKPNKESMLNTENIDHVKNKGKNGSTWDAKHMGEFLHKSRYSNWNGKSSSQESFNVRKTLDRHSTQDVFFRPSRESKNASTIGFTSINPLVTLSSVNMHSSSLLQDYCNKESPRRYESPKFSFYQNSKASQYEGNSVKFRVTDPLSIQNKKAENPKEYEKERMKWLIAKRHPHGITGIDHSEYQNSIFYQNDTQKYLNQRVREEPNSRRTHIIDPTWKSKGRASPRAPSPKPSPSPKIKQFEIREFNIITNLKS